ncbi:MAG: hypothetical protein JNL32_14670 [Candidatus Kapabacteria bacterium]|nr:hypothetical protein [Candidatus Kapabacteria bacterium]
MTINDTMPESRSSECGSRPMESIGNVLYSLLYHTILIGLLFWVVNNHVTSGLLQDSHEFITQAIIITENAYSYILIFFT